MKLRVFLAILVAAFVLPTVSVQGAPEEGEQSNVSRLSGPDRIDSAIKYSQDAFSDIQNHNSWCRGGETPMPHDQAGVVVLVNAANYADGLAGAALAAYYKGGLLMTGSEELDPRVAAEIERISAKNVTCGVFLLGGHSQLSERVEAQIKAMGHKYLRLSGRNRYETSERVTNLGMGAPRDVFLADGNNFPDALMAGWAAGKLQGALMLTNGSQLDPSVKRYLDEMVEETRVYTIGGAATRAYPQATEKFVGGSRFETSYMVAKRFGFTNNLCLASGRNWPDALAAAPHAVHEGNALLLAEPGSVPPEIQRFITENPPSTGRGCIYGGFAAVSTEAEQQLSALIEEASS